MGQRYAIFSAHYPPRMGGVERFTDGLARELAAEGHRVDVVTSDLGAPAHESRAEGVEVWRLPCVALLGGRLPVPRRNGRYHRMLDGLRARRYDGVLVNTRYYGHSLEGVRFARSLGVPLVVLDHSSANIGFGVPVLDSVVHGYELLQTRRIERYAPAFYGVSQMSAAWLGRLGIGARGVIHNAIDADAFRRQASARDFRRELGLGPTDFVISYTGRLVAEKGADTLVEAARLMEAQRPFGQAVPAFLVAGDGRQRAALKAAAPGSVRLLGGLSRADVARLLMQSDLFCFPSRYPEGLPTSLLEAAACGVPIVSSDVGGAREVIPEDDFGTVLPTMTATTLRDAIERHMADRPASRRRGRRCQQHVTREFSWEKTAADLRRAFECAR